MKNKTRSRVLCRALCVLLTLVTVFSAVALSVSAYNDSGVYYHIRAQSSGGIDYFGYDYENKKMVTRSDGEENALYFTFIGGFYVEYAGQMWYGSCAKAGWGAPNSSTISDGLLPLGTTHIDNKNDSAKYGAHFTGEHNNENRTIDTDFIFRCWYYARKNYSSGGGICSWTTNCYMQEAVSMAYRCEWDTRVITKIVSPTSSVPNGNAWATLPDNKNFESSVTQAFAVLIDLANNILRDALVDEDGLKGNIKRPDSYTMTFTKNGTTSIMHLLNMNNPDNERRNRQDMFIFRQSTDVTDYDISAKKVDADTGEVLAGATFKIEMKSGSSWTDMNMPLTTESDGIVTWSNFPPGTYRITETDAPSGYQIDPTPQEVTVGGSSSSSVTVTFRDKPDKPPTYSITIYKYPEGTPHYPAYVIGSDKVLAGAEFSLYKEDGGRWVFQRSLTTVGGAFADMNHFGELEQGRYYVQETKAPPGYELDNTPQYVTLPDDAGGNSTVVLFFEDPESKPNTGAIDVLKHDILGRPISGVTFELWYDEGKVTATGKSATTGSDGIATFTDLTPGTTYWVFETAAPDGYDFDPNKGYSATVVADTTTRVNNGNPVENPPSSYTIELVKYRAGSGFIYLSDATFALYKQNSSGSYTLYSTKVTDSDGKIDWTELEDGNYYYVETIAPKGYELDTTKHYVSFPADGNGKGLYSKWIEEYPEIYWTPQVEKNLVRSFDTAGEPDSNFGEFSFVLQKWNGSDWDFVEQKYIVGSGDVTFKEITYGWSDYGDHRYRVYEEKGDNERVSYDDHIVEFTVTVTRHYSGRASDWDTLTVSTNVSSNQHPASASDKDKTTFTNYVPDGTWTPTAQKVLIGRKLTDDEFTFTLEENVGGTWTTLQTVKNREDHVVPFDSCYYTLENVGTHTYRVREVKGTDSTVIYDDHTVTYTVSVSYDRKNETALTITVDVSSSEPGVVDEGEITTFTNYVPVEIKIEKVDPNGKTLAGAEFCLEWSEDDTTWKDIVYTATIEKGGCSNAGVMDGKLMTGDDGKVVFERLYPGLHYRLTETKAPNGMQLLTESAYEGVLPPDMDVSAPDTTVKLRVVNQPVFTLPATGGHGFWNAALAVPLLCVSIAIIGLALGGGFFKKKKQK